MTASGGHLFLFANLDQIYPIGPAPRLPFTEYGDSGGLVSVGGHGDGCSVGRGCFLQLLSGISGYVKLSRVRAEVLIGYRII